MSETSDNRWKCRAKRFSLLTAAVSLWFLFVYGGADWVASQHSYRIPIGMNWERNIPYVPATVVAYMSIYGLFLLAPFLLRQQSELEQFSVALAVMIGIGGVVFLLFPGESLFEPLQPQSWQSWIRVADALNLDNNYLPSLHVGLSVACVTAYTRRTSPFFSWLLWAWAIAIALSTLLLHEHHVIDVVTGWCLASVCVRYFLPTNG